ncbi:glutathionylspermidine synthase family protein [Paenibacillus filicis]|uniref:Glutathionylspermidine synthase family protein n=1 Tax=Paenibacillus gyeongsangnamensis TaxID=3388067 RepID=A0ABT4Q6J1_9BACL|nr:glutathionylspermidine synthase family protein [Paenibacillus filicis]MCZ8512486.1 glutathionylspermidine synthase family protein [Paenibacillus filicis]
MDESNRSRLTELSYAERRAKLYDPLREEGVFTWDRLYGQEYALADLHRLEESELEGMHAAAEALGRIYAKTVAVVQQGEAALWAELGLPEAAFGALRLRFDESVPTLIGRFDFARTPEGWKMLEFNSDTPTGIVEAFHVNGRICAAWGERDPNEGCSRQLTEAFGRMLQTYREAGMATERIVFSALDWHEEDAGTTRYLLAQSGVREAEFAPLSALRVSGDRLWVAEGPGANESLSGPIDVLYRLHALEKLAEDRDEDGYPTGEHALRLIADRRVAIINPPSGFAAQTKALQALIWSLHEEGRFYSPEEHEAIEAYMLPTYLEPLFPEGTPYVAKPILGREGSGVTIYGADGGVAECSGEAEYLDQPMVYQRLAELPELEVETLGGTYRGRLLWGCFLIDGRASAVVARVGGRITGNLSYYLPSALT